ncbi:MAG TPA: SCO family protein [Candidatus Baltobacteraceae bacterium]|nr:SCO family protein [Candidatus Baltobacteraceae bacterium]
MRFAIAAAAVCLAFSACAQPSNVEHTAVAPPAYRFTLPDQNGKPVTVGQPNAPAALYFGFTHCKDICPQTIQKIERARKLAHLTPQQLRIVMVTVDPARDTRDALKAFIAKTGVDASALTGTSRQLHSIYRAYGVVIAPQKGGDLGHTDYVYLIDHNGRLPQVFSSDTAANAVAQRLSRL